MINPTLPSGGNPGKNGAPPAAPSKARESFRRFAGCVAGAVGSPFAFILATLTVIVWAALGHHYQYSDTWQLVINTGTTIVTFLMVFLIQNTQNRDARAIHLKLDELIRGLRGARNTMVDLESASDEELDKLEQEFKRLRERHPRKHRHAEHGDRAPAAPPVPTAPTTPTEDPRGGGGAARSTRAGVTAG